jgi:hypothetical protein
MQQERATMSYKIERARTELQHLRARYDSGAVSAAVYETIKDLETTISWLEFQQRAKIEITENGHTTKGKRQ